MSRSRADLLARLASVVADYGSTAVLAELGIAADRAGVDGLAAHLSAASREQPRRRMRRVDDALAAMADAEELPSVCRCCAASWPLARFLELPPAAGGAEGDDGTERLAYRNCTCGSTICRGLIVEARS